MQHAKEFIGTKLTSTHKQSCHLNEKNCTYWMSGIIIVESVLDMSDHEGVARSASNAMSELIHMLVVQHSYYTGKENQSA